MSEDVFLTGHEQLHELSHDAATAVLNRFLELERAFFSDVTIPGVVLDHTETSVRALLHWVLKSGAGFGQEAASWPARCGYYFGESLIAHSRSLSWSIGEPGYAFENHPVVVGFKDKMEAPLITVCHNILSSIVEGRSEIERIDSGVAVHFLNI